MRVALVGAEFEENLAVRYLRGALEAAGHQVESIVFNSTGQLEAAARRLAQSSAPLAGLSMVFTHRAREFADLALRARELGYAGHVVAGGHFAAFHASRLLADVPALDSVACGEGEDILRGLAEHLDAPGEVPGLVWRGADGAPVANPPAAKPVDLDVLPWPPRKEPLDRYLGLGITNLLSSRGCTHACAFCSIAAWHRMCGGPRLRLRHPDRVAEEMATLHARGARIFNFHDDNFVLRDREEMRARLGALREGLARRGVGRIAFAIKARPDEVDPALFAELVDMGLFRVFLGIEAGTAESLHRLGRGQTVDDNERALEIVNGLGLHACFNLLLLNPESTLEDLAANVAFLRRHPHNPMNFCRTEVYAGTPLERRLAAAGRLQGDYWGWDYRIAAPRAQLAFELVSPVFRERNHGAPALHERAMALDYELQLLGHFFGAPPDLRRAVKAFLVRVNLDTCDHLEAIVEAVAAGQADGDGRRTVLARMMARVAAADRRLLAESDQLLVEIRRAPRAAGRAGPGWRQAAAAAGLVAAVSLGSPVQGQEVVHSQHSERAPPPAHGQPHAAPSPEATPAPGSPGTSGGSGPATPGKARAELAAVRRRFVDEVLPEIVFRLPQGRSLRVALEIGRDGKVASMELRSEGLSREDRAGLEHQVEAMTLRGLERGKYELELSAEEVDRVRWNYTHMGEMVAPENQPRPTPPDDGTAGKK